MCRDGGVLWICDEIGCNRVVCHRCLIFTELPYFILFLLSCIVKGFYSQGVPVLSDPPVITGGFHHAITSQVAAHSTALVHLHLEDLEVGHPQVNTVHSLLHPYFPEGRYHFSQLPFNLTTKQSMDSYQVAALNLADSLSSYQNVVLFLTTHSDEERGDLFAGFIDGKPVASQVFEFLQVLFTPLTGIVQGADIVFNVCGSVVTVMDSFNGLQEAAQLLKPRSMVLFDAQHLQLATTVPYLLSLFDSTIIQGFDISNAVKFALTDCGMLGRHSNIIVMMWSLRVKTWERLVVEKLVWTDTYIRPWGNYLPVQCPQCGTIQKWVCGSDGQTYSYECKYTLCGKEKGPCNSSIPPKNYTFSIPKNAIQLSHGRKGTSSWLLFTFYYTTLSDVNSTKLKWPDMSLNYTLQESPL
ncbi:hypothetical protein PISMIDRAFT_99066 [Pisolithus microcarpus 441]|uniref:Unplaced genomic scaffold scaffold_35, whole genome shotgun sequence n=1 Tax=Pisolithus microcarpus 441 TaxID=765257 RepID=A0A0C9Z4Y5_9AGAM|nr:hypothetical protein BKA83DRAFT_99066 [Pisolithus microcarpus]KIK24181.1 hypothetical protein PISMIDRAFT_99066 [Pisolithus microcarpus 441]